MIEQANAAWEAEPHENDRFLFAYQFIIDKQAVVRVAQKAMRSAQTLIELQENRKCKPLIFTAGAQVSLKSKHLGIRPLPSRRLFPHWLGPVTVSKVINIAAYQLELPHSWKAHNITHTCLISACSDHVSVMEMQFVLGLFTLVGGKDNKYDINSITGYGPELSMQMASSYKFQNYFSKLSGVAHLMVCRRDSCMPISSSLLLKLCRLLRQTGITADTFEQASNRALVKL